MTYTRPHQIMPANRRADEARLERNIVVELFAFPAAAAARLLGKGRRAPAARRPARGTFGAASHGGYARASAAAAAEHLQIVADHLGRVALVPLLVLPLARAHAPLDVHLRALAQLFYS